MLLITCLLSFALVDGQSTERIDPVNTAVIAGKQFSLLCGKYSDNVRPTTLWKFLRVNTYADHVVYNGTHLSNPFGSFQVHSTSDGVSNLTKRFSSVDDAGTYKCIEKIGNDFVVSSAQVIIFATDPVCNPREARVPAAQYLMINCSVNYVGSISPVMKWSKTDGTDSYIDANNITNIPGNSFMISTLKINVTRRDNSVTFQCTTYFNRPVLSNEDKTEVRKATNAPTYEHQCRTKISVLFETEAADINPKRDVYTIGDILLCTADGNPIPTYEWTELGSNRIVSNEASLTVDSIEMQNHAYKCTATSNVAGKQKSVSTTVTILAIIGSPTGGTDAVRVVSIAAGTVFAILGFVVLIVCIKRLKARFHEDNTPRHHRTTAPDNSDHYDRIDISSTRVDIAGDVLQVHGPSLTERQAQPTDFSNIVQRLSNSQIPPSGQSMIPLHEA